MSKSRKETIILIVLLAAILGVLAFYIVQTGKESRPAPYQPRKVDASIPSGLFKHPQYPRLTSPARLPVEPGATGNPDPFGVKPKEGNP